MEEHQRILFNTHQICQFFAFSYIHKQDGLRFNQRGFQRLGTPDGQRGGQEGQLGGPQGSHGGPHIEPQPHHIDTKQLLDLEQVEQV